MSSKNQQVCPLCESTQQETLATVGRAGEALHTALCSDCGLVFTSPIPTESEVAAYYAEAYRLSYKGVAEPKKKHVLRAGRRALGRLPLVQKYTNPGDRVLDIGSGGGEFLYLLQSRGYRAEGIEPDQGYGGFSVQEYEINVQIGPFAECTFKPNNYNLVTANHVVEHLCNPLAVFQGVFAGLKEGGHFIVEVPNVESCYHAPANKWHFAHVFNFNLNTMENMGRKAGFSVVDSYLVGDCEHVGVTFRKSAEAQPLTCSPANADRVRQTLASYTPWKHYTRLATAQRLFGKLMQLREESASLDHSLSAKQILTNLYRQQPALAAA